MLVMEGDNARDYIARMDEYTSGSHAVRAVRIDQAFSVVQDGDAEITGTLHATAGCWLVLSAEGRLYPVPDDVFVKRYRRA